MEKFESISILLCPRCIDIVKLFGYDKTVCKTVAIEVGMQNSGLVVVLAMKYFTALSALPGAIFSIWHNISGAILAGIWSKQEE